MNSIAVKGEGLHSKTSAVIVLVTLIFSAIFKLNHISVLGSNSRMGQQQIEITIADRTLKIACPAGQESSLLAAADELNARILKSNSSTMITTPEQSLLMTALNLSNDLLTAQAQIARERKAYQSKINLLKSTIERAMLENKEKQA